MLSRREALALLGGAAMLAGGVSSRPGLAQGLPACIVTPEQTEGPFFTDVRLDRSDIHSDPSDKSVREGVPLALALRVSAIDAKVCTPLAGAMVDVWHFDDAVTDRVLARPPYSMSRRRTRNSDDGLYRRGGSRLMISLSERGGGHAGEYHVRLKL